MYHYNTLYTNNVLSFNSLTVISPLIIITSVIDFVTIETLFKVKRLDLVIRQSYNPTVISISQIGSDYQDSTVYIIA